MHDIFEDIEYSFPSDNLYYIKTGKKGVYEVYVNDLPSAVDIDEAWNELDEFSYAETLCNVIDRIKRFKFHAGFEP